MVEYYLASAEGLLNGTPPAKPPQKTLERIAALQSPPRSPPSRREPSLDTNVDRRVQFPE
jgi:hypothetical protein